MAGAGGVRPARGSEGHGVGTLSLLVCEQDMGVIGSGMVLWMESLAGLAWGLSGHLWSRELGRDARAPVVTEEDSLVGGHVLLVPRKLNCTSSWVQTHIEATTA